MNTVRCTDQVVLNLWHPLAAISEVTASIVFDTVLLGERLSYARDVDGCVAVWRSREDFTEGSPVDVARIADALPVKVAYGYFWTTLGNECDFAWNVDPVGLGIGM